MAKVKKFKDLPWKNINYDCEWYSVFEIEDSTLESHEIFVPKEDGMAWNREALTSAYRYAKVMSALNKTDYKMIVEISEDDQISWPHFHIIQYKIKGEIDEISVNENL